MSSFIVENKTINRFLSFLYWSRSGSSKLEYRRSLKEIGCDFDSTLDSNVVSQEFGKKLMTLNCKAVSQRYGEKGDSSAIKNYQFVDKPLTEIFQALKSLQCFLYQCTEGNVPNSKLYKGLKIIETLIMHDIINDLPQWRNGDWG